MVRFTPPGRPHARPPIHGARECSPLDRPYRANARSMDRQSSMSRPPQPLVAPASAQHRCQRARLRRLPRSYRRLPGMPSLCRRPRHVPAVDVESILTLPKKLKRTHAKRCGVSPGCFFQLALCHFSRGNSSFTIILQRKILPPTAVLWCKVLSVGGALGAVMLLALWNQRSHHT